jgi:hypothetical protein
MFKLRHSVLTIALTVLAFSAGLAAGNALAVQPSPGAPQASAIIGSMPNTNGSARPQHCSSTEGPEDYESCKVYFGE